MNRLVVDIETIGIPFESLEEKHQKYLLKFCGNEEEKKEVKESLGLYPLTGEIVAVGMLNPDTKKGQVLYQSGADMQDDFEEEDIEYKSMNEKEILENFWKAVRSFDQIITFNGRSFDVPYIMIRSAVHKVKPSRNFMGNRYDFSSHCDLLDQLTFYGATRRYNLDFYAKRLGIKSSKENENGIDGSQVGEFYKNKKYKEIAQYCAADLETTRELFNIWESYLK